MAAYERALLLITQHTDRVSQDPNRSGDYELLLEVPKKCQIKCHTRQMLNLSNNSKIHYIVHQQCQYSEWIITTHPFIPMWKGEICTQPSYNFEVQFQARKELATAEGFKQDYNFLWRLLGRVHAARGAIQCLMGEEVSCSRNVFQIFAFPAGSVFHLCWSKFSINSHASPLIHPVFRNCATWMYIWCAFFGRQS